MNALFINGSTGACGVAQYGLNLFHILEVSAFFGWDYCEPKSEDELKEVMVHTNPSLCLVNYQALIGGFLANAPFPWMPNPVLVYHDCQIDESKWKAILFSDPTMEPHGKWHPIGRPLPGFSPNNKSRPRWEEYAGPVIGVHGFLGAWADRVVSRVKEEFQFATIRLQLPFSKFCDPVGVQASSMAQRCRDMIRGSQIKLEISHNFFEQPQLLDWLASNDLNCYMRPPEMHWTGVSSAPDCALSVRRPVSVNRCNAFRHLHDCRPSITVEDSSLMEIIGNGLSPLMPLYQKWSPENVRTQVEAVLLGL